MRLLMKNKVENLIFISYRKIHNPPRSQPNLLSSDFTKSLPAYAAKTKERLSGWLDFLTFKNKLIKHKTQGLRYLNWQFNEETGQVHFLVIAEDEQVLKKHAPHSAVKACIHSKPKFQPSHFVLFCRKKTLR